MVTFLISLVLLFLGYYFYSKIIEKNFGINPQNQTPAYKLNDGVDYVPMKWYKVFMIQFLNIAGLGPIFGAIAGAMWGPVAFLWIVLGSIFAGAVHDYHSGMISIRLNGLSINEIVGMYLGKFMKHFMVFYTLILMILVGAVFVTGPAKILVGITNNVLDLAQWSFIIFIYYFLATLLPIDKIIGRVYPLFATAMLFMALGILGGLFYYGYSIPELTLENLHSNPEKFPIFPMMFITIACGAISGFHSTQSPLMARCIENERLGRRVFYGAMITEGIVALIWAAIGMAFFGGVEKLNQVMIEHNGNAAYVVNLISNTLLGKVGAILALLGVVAAPITSGDTALRSARLIIADYIKLNQKSILNRIYIVLPLFIITFILTQIKFDVIWRYMAWTNQTLAMIVLWAFTVYLKINNKNYLFTLIPALFMSMVCLTYIQVAPEGFQLPLQQSTLVSALITVVFWLLFQRKQLSNIVQQSNNEE